MTNFTPSRPLALGLKDGSSRAKIEGLSEIRFDLFPQKMDCSEDFEEVESSCGNIKDITFHSTPLTNFTPSCPPALGLKAGSKEKVEGLEEVRFDLFPEQMGIEEDESIDVLESMVVQTEKIKKPKLRRSKRIAAMKKKSQPLRRSARIAALRKKGNM